MKSPTQDDIISYREMCDIEDVQTLQRGMNFQLHPTHSVILMSRRSNAPYDDTVLPDGQTIEYEGHDVPKRAYDHNPKLYDQETRTGSGTLTQNGYFVEAADAYKANKRPAEKIRVYEKILPGIWSYKGLFSLIDYGYVRGGVRNVYKFKLALNSQQETAQSKDSQPTEQHSRIIPSRVKQMVWKRDKGQCILCGSTQNLHFDHDLPFSRGGTSMSEKNIRLLCMKHNLAKSAKIE